jgi:hypothetical protein
VGHRPQRRGERAASWPLCDRVGSWLRALTSRGSRSKAPGSGGRLRTVSASSRPLPVCCSHRISGKSSAIDSLDGVIRSPDPGANAMGLPATLAGPLLDVDRQGLLNALASRSRHRLGATVEFARPEWGAGKKCGAQETRVAGLD